MRYLCSLLILFISLQCCNTTLKDEKILFKFPVIIENFRFDKEFNQASIKRKYHGNHLVNYFGKMTDTLRIDAVIRTGFNIPPPPSLASSNMKTISIKRKYDDYFINYNDYGNRSYYKRDSFDLTIKMDTTQVIHNLDGKAHPVIIRNNSIDTIMIGYGKFVPIITEAKNKKGKWKPIEKRFIYGCGVGIHTSILPPNEIVVTSQLIYSGDFKTSLRVRYNDYYSEEFSGRINYSQFKDY